MSEQIISAIFESLDNLRLAILSDSEILRDWKEDPVKQLVDAVAFLREKHGATLAIRVHVVFEYGPTGDDGCRVVRAVCVTCGKTCKDGNDEIAAFATAHEKLHGEWSPPEEKPLIGIKTEPNESERKLWRSGEAVEAVRSLMARSNLSAREARRALEEPGGQPNWTHKTHARMKAIEIPQPNRIVRIAHGDLGLFGLDEDGGVWVRRYINRDGGGWWEPDDALGPKHADDPERGRAEWMRELGEGVVDQVEHIAAALKNEVSVERAALDHNYRRCDVGSSESRIGVLEDRLMALTSVVDRLARDVRDLAGELL